MTRPKAFGAPNGPRPERKGNERNSTPRRPSEQDRVAPAAESPDTVAATSERVRVLRERLDQAVRVGMRRAAEDILGRVHFHDSAAMQNGHAVAERGDGKQVVRNIKHGHSQDLAQTREQL